MTWTIFWGRAKNVFHQAYFRRPVLHRGEHSRALKMFGQPVSRCWVADNGRWKWAIMPCESHAHSVQCSECRQSVFIFDMPLVLIKRPQAVVLLTCGFAGVPLTCSRQTWGCIGNPPGLWGRESVTISSTRHVTLSWAVYCVRLGYWSLGGVIEGPMWTLERVFALKPLICCFKKEQSRSPPPATINPI